VDVTVPAGLTSAFFTVTGRAVTSQQTVTITAKLGSITKTAPLTVNAPVVLFRMDFVTIQPGEFNMGCSPGDGACDNDETPVRPVRITRAFDMGKYEVQQQQWEGVMGSNPSFFRGADRPVEQVSWLEIQNFLQRMNARGDGYRYRLPTEAEWEYAARAGSTGATYGSLNNIAWHSENSGGQTHPSGMKDPNAWGLYDIYGNAWEFVADWYGPYAAGAAVDPKGGGDTGAKVMRGGSWTFEAGSYRASDRSRFPTDEKASFVGFRLVRERL
jgi:formylglycine-generating enzyme required for sulfatase activity